MEQYIDKSAVVAEIERKIEAHKETLKNCDSSISEMVLKGSMSAYQSLLHFLNTLEVKEAYLDFQTFAKEMETVFALSSSKTKNTEENPLNWEYAIAKHFFELGIKVKGE